MGSFNGEDSIGDFNGCRITQLDDDVDEYEGDPMEPVNVDEFDDDDDEEEDNEDREPVILGLVQSPKLNWSNLRQLSPDLADGAGGVPVWLDPVNLPSGKSILCDLCEEPLQFVLQRYAPLIGKESAFHRTLFLFMCSSMSCLLRDQHEQCKRTPEKAMRSIKAFRCQLPRFNPYYSSKAPKEGGTDKPFEHRAPLCTWCRAWKGDKLCSGCKNARYCSPKHQALHWRSGHKTECQQHRTVIEKPKVANKSLWKEFELFYEDESEDDDTEMSEDEGIDNKALGDADLNSLANFQQRVAKTPEQVLRCSKSSGAKPLWPMATGRISDSEIPNCKSCGGPLCFEFQVMPQLLSFFEVENERNSLDWSTIVVYTCENSCESS